MSEASILQAVYDQLYDAIERAKPQVPSESMTYEYTSSMFQLGDKGFGTEEMAKYHSIRAHACRVEDSSSATEMTITCWPLLDDFAVLLQRIKQYRS